ncbi:MAG: tail fiber domain-containing protein [Bacteroidales bacterium]
MNAKLVIGIFFLILPLNASGQIKIVCPSMNLGIGLNNNSPSFQIDFLGHTAIRPTASSCFPHFQVCNGTNWYMNSSERFLGRIGNSTSRLFGLTAKYVYGTVVNISDLRLKENVAGMTDMLSRINLLNPVSFDYTIDYSGVSDEGTRSQLIQWDQGRKGFVAQDVQKIFPQLVKVNEADSMLYLQYTGLVPVLVQGMKEQNEQIISLLREISKFGSDTENDALNTGPEGFLFSASVGSSGQPMEIPYYVSDDAIGMELRITDLQADPVLNLSLTDKGLARISIPSFSLPPGMYYCNLILDKKQCDSKLLMINE